MPHGSSRSGIGGSGSGGSGDLKESVDTSTFGLGNIVLSGEQTLNGLLTSTSRVLVTDQADPSENGIYTTDAGVWVRVEDFDEDDEVTNGTVVYVANAGSDKNETRYLLTTLDPITVGTTGQTWEEHLPDPGDSARVQTGTYTGDGTESQGISGVGFTPKYVKVWQRAITNNSNIASMETTDTIVDDNLEGMAVSVSAGTTKTNAMSSLDADGFTVDDNGGGAGGDHPNRIGIIYNYMAIGW